MSTLHAWTQDQARKQRRQHWSQREIPLTAYKDIYISMVINIIVMHVKVSNSDYIELVFCVWVCVFCAVDAKLLYIHDEGMKQRASAVWSCQACGGSDGGLGRPLLLLLLFYRSTHLPFSTHGLFFISSGFRKGSSGTHSSIHFTRLRRGRRRSLIITGHIANCATYLKYLNLAFDAKKWLLFRGK